MFINCFIIEDEPIAVQILRDYIRKTPVLKVVRKISCWDKALDIIRREKPDIIFLDVNLKGTNESCCIREILKMETILIFTTAYSKVFIEEMLQINLAGLGYLHKPISYQFFIKEIERVIL